MGACCSSSGVEASDEQLPRSSAGLGTTGKAGMHGVHQVHATSQPAPVSPDGHGQAAGPKRIAIVATGAAAGVDAARLPSQPKSEAVLRMLERATASCLLFESLPEEVQHRIFDTMALQTVAAGTKIITQGDAEHASTFYVLELGECDVFLEAGRQRRKVHTYRSCSSFGELALLYNAPRAATVVATVECRLYAMERAAYMAIKQQHVQQVAHEKRAMVECVPMLAVLSPEHKGIITEALELEAFAAGEVVFRQGQVGDKLYVVREGVGRVTRAVGGGSGPGSTVAMLRSGAVFGERALSKDEVRAATVTAESRLVCYVLARKAFNDLLGPLEDVWRFEALCRVPILHSLTEVQLYELARCMTYQTCRAGQVVFHKGDVGNAFYVIEEGTFAVLDEQRELTQVARGSCFGELALLRDDVRAATVKALTDGLLLACRREDFHTKLGSLADIRQLWRFEALRKVPLLAPLSHAQRMQLCSAFKPRRVPAGSIVVQKGEEGSTFYIVEAGRCVVVGDTGQEVSQLGPTMYFGELALLSSGGRRAATVRALSDVSLLLLSREDFLAIAGAVGRQLQEQAAAYTPLTKAKAKAVQLQDLQRIAVLGAGAFGQVLLVRHGGACYALKCLSKAYILESGLQDHVKQERDVLAEVSDCPFAVRLVASLKDRTHLYMMMESVMGGELFTYLQGRQRPCEEAQARFYAAAVVMGLHFLEQRNLAWRDLKPENLLMDSAGYLHLADFGFAKRLGPGQRTQTLCGTPEYLAPELVIQSGHGRAVDWWALGVLIFELCVGRPPFWHEDRVTMFRRICRVEYEWPEGSFSKEVRDLVRRLLTHNPSHRLGALKGGALDVQAHPWFKGFDWDAFASRSMPAPYVPQIKSPEDTSHFKATSERPGEGLQPYKSTGVFKDF